jgi:hypothetical protein
VGLRSLLDWAVPGVDDSQRRMALKLAGARM